MRWHLRKTTRVRSLEIFSQKSHMKARTATRRAIDTSKGVNSSLGSPASKRVRTCRRRSVAFQLNDATKRVKRKYQTA